MSLLNREEWISEDFVSKYYTQSFESPSSSLKLKLISIELNITHDVRRRAAIGWGSENKSKTLCV